jgi:hypothetical protein
MTNLLSSGGGGGTGGGHQYDSNQLHQQRHIAELLGRSGVPQSSVHIFFNF